MQDEHSSIEMQKSQENEAQRTRRFIDYLGNLWQRPHEPSIKELKHIAEFAVTLPTEEKLASFRAIAHHFVNAMSLHCLEVMAIFRIKAEQEGIAQEEITGTFEDVFSETWHILDGVNMYLSIQSLEDVVNLAHITIGLYELYQIESAEDAQSVMYDLPSIYYDSLARTQLIKRDAMR